jgi:hypothetical protein
MAGRLLADMALWSGDGRITAGHLAVLRERAVSGPCVRHAGVVGKAMRPPGRRPWARRLARIGPDSGSE